MSLPVWQVNPKVANPKGVTVRPSIDHAAAVVRLIDAVLGANDDHGESSADGDARGCPLALAAVSKRFVAGGGTLGPGPAR
jgi:hypothetical protein